MTSRSRELAELATAYDTGTPLGMRNRIINGDMRIDQRNAGASVSVSNATSFYIDRWKVRYGSNGGTAGTCTVQRSTVAPAGFTNSHQITVGTARTVISGDRFNIEQAIEGFNIADLGWGTATAQPVTLSFWVRSSLTGTFGLCLSNFSRGYAASYTISAANTWEYKTVTIAGDTGGTWATDNSTGVIVSFDIGMGSDVRTSTGSWQAGTFLGATGSTNLVSTSGATFYITGVQLEAGSVATPFERRPYGTELQLCQRYYARFDLDTGVGIAGMAGSTSFGLFQYKFTVQMRAAPTLGTTGTAANYVLRAGGTNFTATGVPSLTAANQYGIRMDTNATGLTSGAALVLMAASSAFLTFSAEL